MKYFKASSAFQDVHYYVVPTSEECALTYFFYFNNYHWWSEVSRFWEEHVEFLIYHNFDIIEVSKLEVLLMKGSIPKIGEYDDMTKQKLKQN